MFKELPPIDQIAFIDFEASSMDQYKSYPIQVGVSLSERVVYGAYIHPHEDWTDWGDTLHTNHNIKRDDLIRNGQDIRVVAHTLNELLICRTVICDGPLDSFWCQRLFEAAGVLPLFKISYFEDYDIGDFLLQSAAQSIDEKDLIMHNAEHDAIYLRRLLTAYQERKERVASLPPVGPT